MNKRRRGYVHVLLLQHLHVHLLDGQRHAHPVVHQLAQTDLRVMKMKRAYLLQQELGLLPAGERVAHLHLDLLAGGSRALDIALALLHPHDFANELCSFLLQKHLDIKKRGEQGPFLRRCQAASSEAPSLCRNRLFEGERSFPSSQAPQSPIPTDRANRAYIVELSASLGEEKDGSVQFGEVF